MPNEVHEMNGGVSAVRFTNSGHVSITCKPQSKDGSQAYPLFDVAPHSAVIARIKPGVIEVDLKSSIPRCGRFMKIESGLFINGEFYVVTPAEQ